METSIRKNTIARLFHFGKRRKIASLLILLAVVGGAYGAYAKFYNISDEEHAQKELSAAVSAASKHMVLPEGDEPVLATVTDAAALTAQQVFFSGAIDGDQLLLFPKSLKAIIYSPSRDKIINAGPIEQQPGAVVDKSQITNPKSQTSSNDQNSNDLNTLTVEVRNGTGKTGYASQFAEKLGANASYEVVKVDDAKRKDYQSAVVFVRADDEGKQSKASVLAASLGVAATNSLPDGEKSTSADVIVILGGN